MSQGGELEKLQYFIFIILYIMTIFKILYGTNKYFEKSVGDEYFSKGILSTRKQFIKLLKEDLKEDFVSKEEFNEIKEKFEKWTIERKTHYNIWDLQLDVWDLQVWINEIDLI